MPHCADAGVHTTVPFTPQACSPRSEIANPQRVNIDIDGPLVAHTQTTVSAQVLQQTIYIAAELFFLGDMYMCVSACMHASKPSRTKARFQIHKIKDFKDVK